MKFALLNISSGIVFAWSSLAASAAPFHIDGGAPVKSGTFDEVVQISSGKRKCVGTFVSSSLLITSSFCVKDLDITLLSDPTAKPIKIYFLKKHELVAVRFQKNQASQIAVLAPETMLVQSNVKLIGFDKKGQKMQGFVRVARTDRGQIISFRGEEIDLGIEHDDKVEQINESVSLDAHELGSPMFYRDQLIGIAIDGDEDYSQHLNLTEPKVAAFLARLL